MIGLDTNVLIRYLIQDEPEQAKRANKVMAALSADSPGFISAIVLAEISWVLTRFYKISREALSETIAMLLDSTELEIEQSEAAYRALARYTAAPKGEFADALIAETAKLAGASQIVTFDRLAAEHFGMTLLD
ncbi:MAG: type II toxin-antitoxin system VapC family toxin [Henriciella sp.]|nr:type II toxin-antitoxin system VapC family toxin [Henriciella sp.]